MLIKVQGTTLVRDTQSMALVNQDKNGLEAYMKQRQHMASQAEQINTLESDMEDIKKDMKEIKKLVMLLLEKGSNG